jgi:ligand-binding sensor domain-containing protein
MFFNIERSLLLVLIISVSTMNVAAQNEDIKFNHITVDNGLANNTVNSIICDTQGFIWISTENGLSRYDGYSFKTFRSNEGISSNITYVVHEDKKERLWVGSVKGLDLFNRKSGTFDKHYFEGTPVRSIYSDKQDRLWIGGDSGVHLFDEEKLVFNKKIDEDVFNVRADMYNTILSITEDSTDNVWIGSSNGGVFVYNPTTEKTRHYYHDPKKKGSLSDNNIRFIIEDKRKKGYMWIATYGNGVNLFNPTTETFTVYTEGSGISNTLTNVIWQDDEGKIWIGTDGTGIDILNFPNSTKTDSPTVQSVIHSLHNSRSLNNNVVRSITSDGRGGIWIGTYAGGLNFFNRNTGAFFHFKVHTDNGNSSATSFAEDKNRNLWIGTDGGGLCYLDRKTLTYKNYTHDKSNKNSLSDNRIVSLILDHQDNLWIGTYGGGLCRYTPHTQTFKNFTAGDKSKINVKIVWTVFQDSKKRIWAGTLKGLNLYDPITETFKNYNQNAALKNNMVRAIFEDSKNRLWVGTHGGLHLYDEKKDEFKFIHGLNDNFIRTINENNKGDLLVGTSEGGINIITLEHNKIEIFKEKTNLSNTESNLPDNMVSGILVDSTDNLWISTGKGLARLNQETKGIKNFYLNDGLQDNQFNINAAYKTRAGEFLFGGPNGYSLFIPKVINDIKPNNFEPPIAFTKFIIFNDEILPNKPGSPLKEQINEATEITLSHDQYVLTFEFAALNFIQPEKNQYEYRLLGFGEDWNNIGNKRSCTFTNLEPGQYVLQVKASNNDGVWNAAHRELKITITPPYWKTQWFKLLLSFILILIAFIIMRVLKKRIKAKIKINKLIAELKMKALIAQMNPHFIFNCLTSIQELIIINKQDEGMYYLEQFSKLLRIVLQSSEKSFVALKMELTLLALYLELEAMRFSKQFHYEINVDPAIDTEEITIPAFLIQPFAENAIWHGLMQKKGDRTMTVSFTTTNDHILVCEIKDNGIGRSEASKIANGKDRTYQSMGLKITKERMELMKKQNNIYNLTIIDEVDEKGQPSGTTVIIKLPLWLTKHGNQVEPLGKNVTASHQNNE